MLYCYKRLLEYIVNALRSTYVNAQHPPPRYKCSSRRYNHALKSTTYTAARRLARTRLPSTTARSEPTSGSACGGVGPTRPPLCSHPQHRSSHTCTTARDSLDPSPRGAHLRDVVPTSPYVPTTTRHSVKDARARPPRNHSQVCGPLFAFQCMGVLGS